MAITDGLVHYWTCDEASGNLIDSVGSLDLTGYHAPSTVDGACSTGSAIYAENRTASCANPTYDKYARATVDVSDVAVMDSARDFTLALYYNSQGIVGGNVHQVLVSCGAVKEDDDGFDFLSGSTCSWTLRMFYSGSAPLPFWQIGKGLTFVGGAPNPSGGDCWNVGPVTPPASFETDVWYALFATYDSNTQEASLYFQPCDPIIADSSTVSSVTPVLTQLAVNTANVGDPYFSIGGLADVWDDCPYGNPHPGEGANAYIDGVGIWNRVLTEDEMLYICNCNAIFPPPPVSGATRAFVGIKSW